MHFIGKAYFIYEKKFCIYEQFGISYNGFTDLYTPGEERLKIIIRRVYILKDSRRIFERILSHNKT